MSLGIRTHSGTLAALAGGLLTTLAFPPFNWPLILFVSLLPLIWILERASPREAWRKGYVFGLVMGLGQLHWVFQLVSKWTASNLLGLLPWLVATVLMALYFGLACFLMQRCFARGVGWLAPLAWEGVEVFRSYIPVFAFPWSLLATPLWRYPAIIQPAHFGTIFLMSAWVVAFNLALYLLIKTRSRSFDRRDSVWPLSLMALGLPCLSVWMYVSPRPTQTVAVTLGQTGIDMAYEADPSKVSREIARVAEGFEDQAASEGSKLLILPEGVARSAKGSFAGFPTDSRVPVLFGGQHDEGNRIYQSAVGFDGSWHFEDKTRLVIFGEFVPARSYLPFLSAFQLPAGDLSAGERGVQNVQLGGLRTGPLLCFEGLFPDLAYKQAVQGARLIPIMSIDDWFMNSSAPEQLRMGSIWRAVETGLPVARSASLGYSLLADGKGRILNQLPLRNSAALTVLAPVPKEAPFNREWPVFPALALSTCLVLLTPMGGRRKLVRESTDH